VQKRRIKFRSWNRAHHGPSAWAWIIPVVAGTAIYFIFAEKLKTSPGGTFWEELLEATPALLVGFLFQVFVLLPLRMLFIRTRMNRPILFVLVASLIWVAISGMILYATNAVSQGSGLVDASIVVPGVVVAAAFTLTSIRAVGRRRKQGHSIDP
jgi:uncharacterized membrane protein